MLYSVTYLEGLGMWYSVSGVLLIFSLRWKYNTCVPEKYFKFCTCLLPTFMTCLLPTFMFEINFCMFKTQFVDIIDIGYLTCR